MLRDVNLVEMLGAPPPDPIVLFICVSIFVLLSISLISFLLMKRFVFI